MCVLAFIAKNFPLGTILSPSYKFSIFLCLHIYLFCFFPNIFYVPYWYSLLDRILSTSVQFSSAQSLSCVRLFVTPRTAARRASLSITNSQSPPKPMCIELVMPSNRLILCHSLLLLPSMFSSIRVFSDESALRIRGPKY